MKHARIIALALVLGAAGCSAGGGGSTPGTGGAAAGAGGSGGRGGGAGGGGSGGSGGTGGNGGTGGSGGSVSSTGGTGGSGTPDASKDSPSPMPDAGAADSAAIQDSGPSNPPSKTVLVFSHTTGFRHTSIPPAVSGLRTVLQANGFTVEASEDPGVITAAKLQTLAGLILVSTTGKPIGDSPQAALAAVDAWVQGGGALVGLHATSSTEYEAPVIYTRLIGGRFVDHPGGVRQANCHGEGNHPAAVKIPDPFVVRDEIYVMSNLNPANQVLLRCEAFGNTANRLPIAWHRQEGQGRVFYTALGHENSDWTPQSPYLRDHALPGILWALGK